MREDAAAIALTDQADAAARHYVETVALGEVNAVRDDTVIGQVFAAIDRAVRAQCPHAGEPGVVTMVNLPCGVAACGPCFAELALPLPSLGACDLCGRQDDRLTEFAVQGGAVVAFGHRCPRCISEGRNEP